MTTGDEEAEGLVDDLFRDVDDQFDDLEREYSEARQDLARSNPEVPSIEVPSAEIPTIEVPSATELSDDATDVQGSNDEASTVEEVQDAVTPGQASPGEALTIEVEDQFADLEREYSEAREELASTTPARIDSPSDALEASTERFELMSQVATLEAEVSRQADELDERDRMLNELGDKIAGFETEIAERESTSDELHAARQETVDARREQARLSALLDARAAERQELADVALRLQHDRDHIQDLLTTALARYDEAEARMAQMDDKVRHIEAERDTAAHEHDARAHELIESRAEMSKLADRLDELAANAADADGRAEKSEALAERRANEAGYLNRRIAAMTDKLEAADGFASDATSLRSELADAERRITELERELATEQSESAAARAAVDAIAERTSGYEELVAENERLRDELDEAWKAASGHAAMDAATLDGDTEDPASEQADRAASLAERAHELSGRRASEAALAAEAAEQAAAETAARRLAETTEAPTADVPVIDVAEVEVDSEELGDLDDDDVALIESDLDELAPSATALPRVPDASVQPLEAEPVPSIDAALVQAAKAVAGETPEITQAPEITETPEIAQTPQITGVPAVEAPGLGPAFAERRKRTILPADLEPNTPEAVAHLLNQPGVTAIVDARSTCGRTGIRPSDLFERIAGLRDYFDVPVEVVVTPVSTPVGGAPDLPAIGVHHITGADTVADRIRALCMGFPADQPLVVIAGDDHVRRAAIGEEANVVEPAAVLNLPTD